MSLPSWLEKQVSEVEQRRREMIRRAEEPIYTPPRIPELHKRSGNPNPRKKSWKEKAMDLIKIISDTGGILFYTIPLDITGGREARGKIENIELSLDEIKDSISEMEEK